MNNNNKPTVNQATYIKETEELLNKSNDYDIWRNQSKRNRKPTWQWVRHMVNRAYTGDEWVDRFKSLPPTAQWKILNDVNPQPKEIDVKSGVSITLQIQGVEPKHKVIDAQVVEPLALTEGELEDD